MGIFRSLDAKNVFYDNTISGLAATNVQDAIDEVHGPTPVPGVVSVLYFGDPNTDGTWRIKPDSTDLAFERRELTVWVQKQIFQDS